MQSLGLFCVRFNARTHAYVMLLTPRYPAFGDYARLAASLIRPHCPPVP